MNTEDNDEITEFDTITLTLDDDSELLYAILDEFDLNEKHYVALLPINEEGDPIDDGPEFFHYSEKDGESIVEIIEDDDEYNAAVDYFFDSLEEEDDDL